MEAEKTKSISPSNPPDYSAIAGLTKKIPIVEPGTTMKQVREYLNKNINQLDTINYIYVVNKYNNLVGVFSIKEIFRQNPEKKVSSVMIRKIIRATPAEHENRIANRAVQHNIKAIPIIDKNQIFLGIIPNDHIHVILKYQFIKRLNQLAGIIKTFDGYTNALDIPAFTSFMTRIPWLLVGLFGGILLARFLGIFEETLKENIILAAFIPAITYISNATAIQVQTIFIRDLAFNKNLALKPYFIKQFFITFLIAVCCSLLLMISAILGWTQTHIIVIISISMFFTIIFAAILSLLIPYIVKKINMDPGVASGPFSTILQDISSVIIYFLIATLLL